MKPALARFFDSMDRYFSESTDEAGLLAELGPHGWEENPARLGIYGRFVRLHLRHSLEKVYPLCRRALESAGVWNLLVDEFRATRPSRHFEINRAVQPFPAFLADRAEALALPPYVPALARFEWTQLEVYMDLEDLRGVQVERLTPNPTLQLLEHDFRLCDFVAHPEPRPPAPEPLPERALLWRHPQTHLTTFLRADDAALLVLKLALEGHPVEEAAQAGGIPVARVQAEVERLGRAGMVLLPTPAVPRPPAPGDASR